MASLSSNEQRKMAYFHSLAKVMTENAAQEVFESRYKSSHNVRLSEVWGDSISYCPTPTLAYQEYLNNPAVKMHEMVTLTPVAGSNGMAYYFSDNGRFSRPWISPVDVPNKTTNLPSNGFDLKLFRQDNTAIGATEGSWVVDYYAGIIHFGQYNTPTDLGWGNIRATFFEYVGSYGISGVTFDGFVTCEFDTVTNTLTYNKGLSSEYVIDISSLKGEYKPSLIAVDNDDMVAMTTILDGDLACNTGLISNPLTGSMIEVFVNGIKVSIGNGDKNGVGYFSSDGITPKTFNDITVGDKLYWMQSNAGYNLDSSIDRISFIYLTN